MSEKTDRFINHLRKLDRRAYAELRRSLGNAPGRSIAAIPYVEPFTVGENQWRSQMYYLVAGLICSAERPLEQNAPTPSDPDTHFGESVGKLFVANDKSPSTERRFIRLLDADAEQLPQRLRQMVALLRSEGVAVNWSNLLDHLLYWQSDEETIQHRWARGFYHVGSKSNSTKTSVKGETL